MRILKFRDFLGILTMGFKKFVKTRDFYFSVLSVYLRGGSIH